VFGLLWLADLFQFQQFFLVFEFLQVLELLYLCFCEEALLFFFLEGGLSFLLDSLSVAAFLFKALVLEALLFESLLFESRLLEASPLLTLPLKSFFLEPLCLFLSLLLLLSLLDPLLFFFFLLTQSQKLLLFGQPGFFGQTGLFQKAGSLSFARFFS